jgi:GTPase SAR1 family protein
MYNTIFIHGTAGSGKSTMVKKFCEGKKSVWLPFYQLKNYKSIEDPFLFQKVTKETEVIVFDEVPSIKAVRPLIEAETITIEKRGFEPFTIPKPLIIIISNKNSFTL